MGKVVAQTQDRDTWPGAVVLLYLLGMTLMFAHLGTPHTRPPPTFVLPRILVMAAVAVLVWRRGGLPSSMRQSTKNVVFEAGMVITASSLVTAYVWHLVEVVVYVVLLGLLTVVETLTGLSLTCEDCAIAFQLQFLVVTAIAALALIWVLHFAMTIPLTQRIVDSCMDQNLGVRFWSKVKVVFINPKSHILEHPMEANLCAPGGGNRNPVVKAPTFPSHLD